MSTAYPEYPSFLDLMTFHVEGRDFYRKTSHVAGARVAIIAPHGGRIEPETDEIAEVLAGKDFSLYCFLSRLSKKEANLHITSHRFDDPKCIRLIEEHDFVVAVHGWAKHGEAILIGGLDVDLGTQLRAEARRLGISTPTEGQGLTGAHPLNICNRGRSRRGVQLELSIGLRRSTRLPDLLTAFRKVLLEHQ